VKRPTIEVIDVGSRQIEEKGQESGSRPRGGKPAGWDAKF